MAAVSSILLAVGAGLGAAGLGIQYKAQRASAKAQTRAEQAREKAMNLDAQRRQRQVIREMQVARATALSNATSQGASEGSGLQGGYGQISGQGGTSLVGIEQNRQIGGEIFAANRAQAKAGTMGALGSAFTSIGGMMIENRGEIGRVGASLFA